MHRLTSRADRDGEPRVRPSRPDLLSRSPAGRVRGAGSPTAARSPGLPPSRVITDEDCPVVRPAVWSMNVEGAPAPPGRPAPPLPRRPTRAFAHRVVMRFPIVRLLLEVKEVASCLGSYAIRVEVSP